MKRAFTLPEMLVVIAILSILGVVFVTILSRSLRGNNKSQILGVIKQNGQSVLENMGKNIRGAKNIVCVIDNPATLVNVNEDGVYTRYRFIPPDNTNTSVGNCGSANGCLLQDTPLQPSTADINSFIASVCSDPMSQVNILTDTNPQTGVSVTNPSFKRDQLSGFKDQVTVKFDLKPGISAPEWIRGQIDPITFQTTINLR